MTQSMKEKLVLFAIVAILGMAKALGFEEGTRQVVQPGRRVIGEPGAAVWFDTLPGGR